MRSYRQMSHVFSTEKKTDCMTDSWHEILFSWRRYRSPTISSIDAIVQKEVKKGICPVVAHIIYNMYYSTDVYRTEQHPP